MINPSLIQWAVFIFKQWSLSERWSILCVLECIGAAPRITYNIKGGPSVCEFVPRRLKSHRAAVRRGFYQVLWTVRGVHGTWCPLVRAPGYLSICLIALSFVCRETDSMGMVFLFYREIEWICFGWIAHCRIICLIFLCFIGSTKTKEPSRGGAAYGFAKSHSFGGWWDLAPSCIPGHVRNGNQSV